MRKANRWSIVLMLVLGVALVLLRSNVAYAAVIVVAPSGGNYTTIQAAVNHASPGDVIAVKTGTYNENVDLSLMGSAIGGPVGNLALVAVDGPGTAVVNGSGTKLTNSASFNADLIVDGFTIANSSDGSGIKLSDVVNLTVVNTTFNPIGDGVSFPTDPVADNAIDLTTTTGAGSVTLFRNSFTNITDGAVALTLSGSAAPTITIAENTITDDASSANVTKRGIVVTDSSSGSVHLTINHNSLTNFGTTGTQVIALTANTSAQLTAQVDNNTIANLTTTAQGLTVTASGNSVVDLTASDNTISNLSGAGAIFVSTTSTAQTTVRIMRNTLSSLGASAVNHGIALDALSGSATKVLRVEGNSVNGTGGSGLRIREIGTGPLTAQATVRNNSLLNTVQGGGTNAGFYGLVGTGATDNATLTLNLTGNTVDAGDFRLENGPTNAGQFRLEGNTGLTPQQNVDANNTNGGAPAQIVGTVTVVAVGTITAPSEDRPPVAADDSATASTATPTTLAVLANDSDPDGGDSVGLDYFTPVSMGGGTLTRDDNGTPSNRTDDRLVYTPLAGFLGTDTLYYTGVDASGITDVAKVTVTVVALATPPTITPNVSGTLGDNGWYTSDVVVSWTVDDNGSPISSSSGCGTTTISTDTAGVTLTCTATNAGGTTSASVTIKRDATAPDTSITANPPTPTNSTSASFSFSGSDNLTLPGDLTFECKLDGGGFAACTSPQSYSGLSLGSHTFQVRAKDAAGNTDASLASFIWTIDTAPPAVTINQAAGQADPTSDSPIHFTVVFTEPVTGFTDSDVTPSGTAGATTATVTEIAPNDGTTYDVAVSGMTSSGTVIVSIPAGAAQDAAGNGNTASFSTDNTVTFVLDNTPPDTSITANPPNPTNSTSASFSFTGSDNLTLPGDLTFECQLDGGAFAACTSPQSYSGLSLGSHTFAVRAIDGVGNVDPTPASYTWEIHAATTLLYNGAQIVNVGGTFQPAAKLSSTASACVSGQQVSFALDRDPFTGVPGSYLLGTATTNGSGQATLSPAINTTGWQEGIYDITAVFAGTSSCDPSSDEATLTVASPGNAATGGGWYTLNGSGRINFGFTVRKADSKCQTNCTYKGQLLLINNGKWRLKGTLNTYSKLATGKGAASGTGDLYWWDASLNGGLGDWALAQSGVSYTINFYDSGKSGKSSTDTFGIRIVYTPVSPPQPSTLPNSAPQLLKGGDIKVS